MQSSFRVSSGLGCDEIFQQEFAAGLLGYYYDQLTAEDCIVSNKRWSVKDALLNEADVLLTAATIIVRQRKEAENAASNR